MNTLRHQDVHASQDGIAPVWAEATARRLGFRYSDDSPWLILPEGVGLELTLDIVPRHIPNTPAWIAGVINWRGTLLPVFDLSAWLSGARTPMMGRRTVVVGKGQEAAALLTTGEPRVISCVPAPHPSTPPCELLRPFLKLHLTGPDGDAYEFAHVSWFRAAGGQRTNRIRADEDSTARSFTTALPTSS